MLSRKITASTLSQGTKAFIAPHGGTAARVGVPAEPHGSVATQGLVAAGRRRSGRGAGEGREALDQHGTVISHDGLLGRYRLDGIPTTTYPYLRLHVRPRFCKCI
jgi:hypothetical protein